MSRFWQNFKGVRPGSFALDGGPMPTAGRSASLPGLRDVRRARALLGVAPDADAPALSRAYRRLARRLHPDLSADPEASERFRALHAAYQLALDSLLRAPLSASLTPREQTDAGPAAAPGGPWARAASEWAAVAGTRSDDGVWVVAGPVRIDQSRSVSEGGPR